MSVNKHGPPRVIIPQDVIDTLEDTYIDEEPYELPVEPNEVKDAEDFIRIAKLHAKREGKSFRHKWNTEGTVLTFQLVDKRPYTRSSLPREKN